MKAPDTGPGLVDVAHNGHAEQFIVRELRKADALTFQGPLTSGEVSHPPAAAAVA